MREPVTAPAPGAPDEHRADVVDGAVDGVGAPNVLAPAGPHGARPTPKPPSRHDARRARRHLRLYGVERSSRHLMRVSVAFALPGFIAYVAFAFGPSLAASYYAFTDWNGLQPDANFVGLRNLRSLFDNKVLSDAIVRTVILGGLYALTVNVIGLALALGLNRQLRTRNFLRALFLAPFVVSPLAIGYVWRYMLQPEGAINALLGAVGLDSLERPWLADPTFSFLAVLASMVWHSAGLAMVIYLAGLQSIPNELYEVSAVDGAGAFRQFRNVTFPLLAPALTANVLLSVLFGLKAFDQVMSLTRGGPGGTTETLATTVYKQVFVHGQYGAGSMTGLALTALVVVISVPLFVVMRRREER